MGTFLTAGWHPGALSCPGRGAVCNSGCCARQPRLPHTHILAGFCQAVRCSVPVCCWRRRSCGSGRPLTGVRRPDGLFTIACDSESASLSFSELSQHSDEVLQRMSMQGDVLPIATLGSPQSRAPPPRCTGALRSYTVRFRSSTLARLFR